jgi:hypothetical protein
MLSRFIEHEQADIYGRLIPSKLSFLLLINELPDEASENEFIRKNNLWVRDSHFKYYPEDCILINIELNEIHKLMIKLLQIEKRQADLLEISFPEYIQSRAVVHWFLSLWGNYSFKNLQAIYRDQDLKEIPTNRLRIYPEYVIAEDNLNRLENLISFPILGGSEALDLVQERKKVSKQLAKAIDKRKTNVRKKNGAFMCPRICIYCGKYISIHKGETCKDCENKANASRVKKSKEKKRLKDTEEKWVKVKVGICVGECASDRRRVNKDHLCKPCWKSSKKRIDVKNVTPF